MNRLLTLVFALWAGSTMARPLKIEDLKWKNRILILAATPSEGPSWVVRQLKILLADMDSLKERDMAVIDFTGETAKFTDFSDFKKTAWKPFEITKKLTDKDTVKLIGKDGGTKKIWAQEFPLKELYNIIDAMPMRINEMRQKKGK